MAVVDETSIDIGVDIVEVCVAPTKAAPPDVVFVNIGVVNSPCVVDRCPALIAAPPLVTTDVVRVVVD